MEKDNKGNYEKAEKVNRIPKNWKSYQTLYFFKKPYDFQKCSLIPCK